MAIKFQYNKTTIQQMSKQLSMRQKALPILKNKETALRLEVKKRQHELEATEDKQVAVQSRMKQYLKFWDEFPNILFINKLNTGTTIIIGVKVPVVQEVEFKMANISWWQYPAWIPSAIEILKEAITLDIQAHALQQQIAILDNARKKTTQKVNLYEKVQIPEMEQVVVKVKRFLEDKENISRSGQKIMKNRKSQLEVL
ncbi:V-type ATP synthase subunit D [Marinoscillum pacificum]|uniref:V-type ATP synthase subunit D n=1 Tax=Marinoscillum pacificum TaxID=392723 RepID=UPI0021571FC7|nr:V-type ATP synthase subunit D [Marinoscillum pacificum]